MVGPLGALEVADLVHFGLESIVHLLWPLSFVDGEPSDLSFNELHSCNLDDLSPCAAS
jgi:hypothetical protein